MKAVSGMATLAATRTKSFFTTSRIPNPRNDFCALYSAVRTTRTIGFALRFGSMPFWASLEWARSRAARDRAAARKARSWSIGHRRSPTVFAMDLVVRRG